MATVRRPSSVAARNTRIAISLRLATSSFLNVRSGFSRLAFFRSSTRRAAVIGALFSRERGLRQRTVLTEALDSILGGQHRWTALKPPVGWVDSDQLIEIFLPGGLGQEG